MVTVEMSAMPEEEVSILTIPDMEEIPMMTDTTIEIIPELSKQMSSPEGDLHTGH